jgi:hypothetical protein
VWREEVEKVIKEDGQPWAVALLLQVTEGRVAGVRVGEGLEYDGGNRRVVDRLSRSRR